MGFLDTNEENGENNQKVDVIVKPKELVDETINNNLFFLIRFNIDSLSYCIKDLVSGYGTFVKIINETLIKDNDIINIGNTYLVCIFGNDDVDLNENNLLDCNKALGIKVFKSNSENESYFFEPKQKPLIYIGRDIGCNIIVDDILLSPFQCTIEYKEPQGWVIIDGKIDNVTSYNKRSINGTWVCLTEETEINDGMVFQSNQTVYQCHLKK